MSPYATDGILPDRVGCRRHCAPVCQGVGCCALSHCQKYDFDPSAYAMPWSSLPPVHKNEVSHAKSSLADSKAIWMVKRLFIHDTQSGSELR